MNQVILDVTHPIRLDHGVLNDEPQHVTPEMASEQRSELADLVGHHVHPATLRRHDRWRTLPKRDVADVAQRLVARLEKRERRAAAARKAGLLP